MQQPRLLYLGVAFPPGVAALFPDVQPAQQITEPRFVDSIRPWFEIRSVGTYWVDVDKLDADPTASRGLPTELNLMDCSPELWTRHHSLHRLKQTYKQWVRTGWKPDLVLVVSFTPIYNAFIRWLRRQPDRPKLVLFLGDCPTLGETVPPLKRLRYRLKPLVWFEDEMMPEFDACAGASLDAQQFFTKTGRPWLWLPPGVDPDRIIPDGDWPTEPHPVFGYFGSLGEHTGVPAMLEAFCKLDIPNSLRIAGFGKNTNLVQEYARKDSRIEFAGTLAADAPPLFAQKCDVMINPRLDAYGNRYSFPSKLLEYGQAGRAILTANMSGVDEMLGPEAYYFDPRNLEAELGRMIRSIGKESRNELQRRGAGIQHRLLDNFTWKHHGERLGSFLRNLI
jgi:glycosyltransferase involved in cell wall biosynthesis